MRVSALWPLVSTPAEEARRRSGCASLDVAEPLTSQPFRRQMTRRSRMRPPLEEMAVASGGTRPSPSQKPVQPDGRSRGRQVRNRPRRCLNPPRSRKRSSRWSVTMTVCHPRPISPAWLSSSRHREPIEAREVESFVAPQPQHSAGTPSPEALAAFAGRCYKMSRPLNVGMRRRSPQAAATPGPRTAG